MVKKLVWLGILGALLIFVLPQVFFQLSLLFDSSEGDITRVVTDDDSGLLLPPEFDTLPTATNSAQLVVHGFSQSASEVELFINDIGKERVAITKADGSFRIRNVRLFEGENVLTLVAYDKRGNTSAHSDPEYVHYKRGAPKLAIQEPDDNKKNTGDDREVTIVGLTDADSEVTINGRWIRVKADGTFSHSVQLAEGDNEYRVVATDEAGNETVVTRKVTYSNE